MDEMSQHGQSAVDQEAIRKETSQMLNTFSSLMNADGLDAQKWLSAMQAGSSSYMKLLQAFARPSAGIGAYQTNIRCITKAFGHYTNFISSLPSGCTGGSTY